MNEFHYTDRTRRKAPAMRCCQPDHLWSRAHPAGPARRSTVEQLDYSLTHACGPTLLERFLLLIWRTAAVGCPSVL